MPQKLPCNEKMKRFAQGFWLVVLIGLTTFVILTAPSVWDMVRPSRDVPDAGVADLNNGKTLFVAADCAICHTSVNQKDPTLLGGGGSLSSAFGTFYMPNISSDAKDGIGAWTTPQMIRAMREGVSPTGQNEYPVLPYTSYQRMSANDIRDLLAYMKTLPAVPGKVRDHDLKFPFTMRRGVGLWRLLFLDGKPLAPDAQQTASWTRGQYLVEGPAHCAECHSPRNFMGGIVSAKRFAGGLSPDGKAYIPNITDDETGIAYWSANEIASYLKDGISPIKIKAAGDMAEVIVNTAKLTDGDRLAMAQYIKSRAGVDLPNAGMPEPNRTAVIHMLPKADDKAAESKLTALGTLSASQLTSAATLYAVTTKPFTLDRAQAGGKGAEDGKILASTKMAVLAHDGNMVQVRIDGWQQEGSDSALYALKGQRILDAVLSPAAIAKAVKGKPVHDADTNLNWSPTSLTVWVQQSGSNADLAQIWQYGGDLYGSSCASCHTLQPANNFLANQWIGTLGAMKRYTSLEDDQYRLLLAYLQYHAKDAAAPAAPATSAAPVASAAAAKPL
jgi:mono/diheme cytochrome c family protein